MDVLTASVTALFEEQAIKAPKSEAVRYRASVLTYGELNSRANQVARHLRSHGVTPETLVAVSMDRSPEAIIALLGILKAGAVFVPLDLRLPPHRLREIIADSGLSVALTMADLQGRFRFDGKVICIDRDWTTIADKDSANFDSEVGPDSAAYVMYTSGSTGKPKGVVGIHRSITNGLSATPFDKDRTDEVCALNTSLSVGFSISRMFLPLLCGIPLVIIPEEESKYPERLVSALQASRVTSAAIVTPLFREILSHGIRLTSQLGRVRTLTVGGSTLTPDIVESFKQAMPHAKLLNGYGATEIGGAAIVWTIDGTSGAGQVSVGRPFPNTRIYILDADLTPVPPGTVGEIWVGAAHLAQGYLNKPQLTAERFIRNPFDSGPGTRIYRTGDMGRSLTDGQIELLGRIDDQVKIRGFRVEIGEVEAVLLGHEQVYDAVVATQGSEDDRWLVAYVVLKGEMGSGGVADVRNYLRKRLPEHMVPSAFFELERLPRTFSGKIDRDALPPPASARSNLATAYVAPRNSLETSIAEIWAEGLRLDRVGIHDHFLDIGGHSLVAIQIVSAMYDRLGVECSPELLLERPTIAELAAELCQ